MKPETERLILRPFTLNDTSFILKLLNTAGWLKYIGDRHVHSLADAQNYLRQGPLKSYRVNGFGLSAVELISSGELVGMCGLIKRPGLDDVDLGFAFLPEFTGKGYATEIANACLAYAFNTLHLKRVIAITLPENKASIAVLQKVGMKPEGTILLPGETEQLRLFSTTGL
ncbi:MAG: GNAT family N-acetyltransferase [Bacteroidetes bacterium]|nr:GNAT family N-acetyltransferase [Bacteroidota bacterium]